MDLQLLKEADLLIVMGTSLNVAPASSLPYLYRGKYIVVINKEETQLDKYATLVINDLVERILPKVKIERI